ncbi:MAG: hypothetical protein EHM61_26590 [Acidobacteria bacterium]|nr:MAG: hypothetical protein EHM61_26590 [Acidobacteriota bacterium]
MRGPSLVGYLLRQADGFFEEAADEVGEREATERFGRAVKLTGPRRAEPGAVRQTVAPQLGRSEAAASRVISAASRSAPELINWRARIE